MTVTDTTKILGINFFNGSRQDAVDALKSGGLLVVPAAPALVNIKNDPQYYHALQNADIVVADSGFMVLIWNVFHKGKMKKLSGLQFLVVFIADNDVKATKEIMLIDPRKEERDANISYLNSMGFAIDEDASYLAPMYDKNNVADPELLKKIEEKKPKYIILNLGGGTQEKLGSYLKDNLSYKPAIICTGAAIAFLTGQQAKIPGWVDAIFMAWLFRCFEKPMTYFPRYLKAFKLLPLMLKNGSEMPSYLNDDERI